MGLTFWRVHNACISPLAPELAQLELLDLARSGQRKRLRRKNQCFGVLYVGERGAHVAGQFFLVDDSARRRTDERGDFFAPFFVRQSYHRHLADLGMAKQQFFEFARIDVLAASDDHVL